MTVRAQALNKGPEGEPGEGLPGGEGATSVDDAAAAAQGERDGAEEADESAMGATEDPAGQALLEQGLGLGESCWEEGKDGRGLSEEGKRRVEEIVRGIAGQVSPSMVP